MEKMNEPAGVRKGRFLWMEPAAKASYINDLNWRIKNGYFSSDAILNRLVDDIAPVIGDQVDRDLMPAGG